MSEGVLTIGSGPHHVLCLHGWLGSARGWGSISEYLDRASFTYAFMDLRGYGSRQAQPGAFTMEEAADDAVALADRLGWDSFSLLGHSMSGQAVQHVLLRAPQRVRRIVGVSPVPATGVPFDADTEALFTGAVESLENRATIVDFTTGNRLTRRFIDHIVRHSQENSTTEAFGAYLRSWSGTNFADRVQGNPARVKVIVGEHDPALSAEVMTQTWLQFYPHTELEVLSNAGHYPMYETPVALVTAIEQFLVAT